MRILSFEVLHNHSSANDVLASIYLKALMNRYYALQPGASVARHEQLQEIIFDFGKPEKEKPFDIRNYGKDQKQARGA